MESADMLVKRRRLNATGNISKTLRNFCVGGADMSLIRQGKKQATATEDFEFHISYL